MVLESTAASGVQSRARVHHRPPSRRPGAPDASPQALAWRGTRGTPAWGSSGEAWLSPCSQSLRASVITCPLEISPSPPVSTGDLKKSLLCFLFHYEIANIPRRRDTSTLTSVEASGPSCGRALLTLLLRSRRTFRLLVRGLLSWRGTEKIPERDASPVNLSRAFPLR